MNELMNIESKILFIRGQQVMLDRDLAELYGVETKRINEAVRRNIERFPEQFMFKLTKSEQNEVENRLRSQIATLENLKSQNLTSSGRGKYSKYLYYAFTEQGIAMLSAVLRSKIAIQVSIAIMNAFVKMRHYLSLKYTSKVHDRFLILDNREIYHVGASLKDLGKKCFAFTQLMDAKSMIKTVLETV